MWDLFDFVVKSGDESIIAFRVFNKSNDMVER